MRGLGLPSFTFLWPVEFMEKLAFLLIYHKKALKATRKASIFNEKVIK